MGSQCTDEGTFDLRLLDLHELYEKTYEFLANIRHLIFPNKIHQKFITHGCLVFSFEGDLQGS